jgi:hypothetical protein
MNPMEMLSPLDDELAQRFQGGGINGIDQIK